MWTSIGVSRFTRETGHCFLAADVELPCGDTLADPGASTIALYEDDQRLGPAHAHHSDIRSLGRGRFSHWDRSLYLSTSDNSDPQENGRRYRVRMFSGVPPTPDEPVSADTIDAFIAWAARSGRAKWFRQLEAFSMLHWQSLAALQFLGRKSPGAIVEIGSYTGASTIALADVKRSVITIEKGGRYDHPYHPSMDILGDLRRNLANNNLLDRVAIIEGLAGSPEVLSALGKALDDQLIGLLVLDADGNVDRDLAQLWSYMGHGCLIALDDYTTGDAKGTLVKPVVDRLCQAGLLDPFGIYGWGTWVGMKC